MICSPNAKTKVKGNSEYWRTWCWGKVESSEWQSALDVAEEEFIITLALMANQSEYEHAMLKLFE